MGILLWVIVGIVIGSVARWVMPGPSAGGIAVAIPIAVGSAVMGGLLGAVFNGAAVIDFDFQSFLMAMIGAVLAMLCYRSYALRATA